MKLKKFCSKCNENLIDINEKYCDKCSSKIKDNQKEERRNYFKRYNDNREEINQFYSSKEWKKIRDIVKTNDLGLCRVCLAKGIITHMATVHHIVRFRDDYSLRLELEYLICVCDKCHKRIHDIYNKSEEDKQEMINLLQEIRDKDINDIIK